MSTSFFIMSQGLGYNKHSIFFDQRGKSESRSQVSTEARDSLRYQMGERGGKQEMDSVQTGAGCGERRVVRGEVAKGRRSQGTGPLTRCYSDRKGGSFSGQRVGLCGKLPSCLSCLSSHFAVSHFISLLDIF